ncbi:unnamed protein product [Phytophthora lilii]|uniref:Unnamed protein product n=1 Tax=Phytophthora lilii TaxID=2077276 RepID=A0A9W6TZR6_9STRA|nr:unnamed protein product [Phytophthora lilii]
MKALKWELVRQLRMTGSPTSTGRRASLSPSSSTRIALNWRLNEDVSLRQSVVSPKKASNNEKDTDSSVNALALQAAIVSDTPAETPRNPVSLLAPRRSFLKNPESASRAVSSPNQAPDADAKETPTSPDATSRPTPSSTSPRDSMDRTEDIPPLNLVTQPLPGSPKARARTSPSPSSTPKTTPSPPPRIPPSAKTATPLPRPTTCSPSRTRARSPFAMNVAISHFNVP